jgi:hypothetical protein
VSMILAYVNGSVGCVAIVSLVVQTWLLHVAACAVRCYVLGPYGPSSGITCIKMLKRTAACNTSGSVVIA